MVPSTVGANRMVNIRTMKIITTKPRMANKV